MKPSKPTKTLSSLAVHPPAPEPLVRRLDLSAFNLQRRLGSGGQGSVFLANVKGSTQLFAVKLVRKDGRSKTEHNVTIEKEILKLNRGDRFLTSLEGAFHNRDAYCLVMVSVLFLSDLISLYLYITAFLFGRRPAALCLASTRS